MALLEVDDLHVHFDTREGLVRAVDGVSFRLSRGETVAIVGESGSGKSVTALAIMGLLSERASGAVVSGDIRFEEAGLLSMSDKRLRTLRGNRLAMIFQDPTTSLNPVYRVGRQVAESLRIHTSISRKGARRVAVDLLERVGIADPRACARRFPHELSGGMRQRVMIAMALVCGPDVLIADEPTSSLDVTVQAQVLQVLAESRKEAHSGMILITHDLGAVADVADRILVMYAGAVVESGTAEEIYYNALHPYTRGLLRSLPRHDEVAMELKPITGNPPSLIDLPEGCVFRPRCDSARPGCGAGRRRLVGVTPSHFVSCTAALEQAAGEGNLTWMLGS